MLHINIGIVAYQYSKVWQKVKRKSSKKLSKKQVLNYLEDSLIREEEVIIISLKKSYYHYYSKKKILLITMVLMTFYNYHKRDLNNVHLIRPLNLLDEYS